MSRERLSPARDILGLVFFVAVCLAVGGAGGAITSTSVTTWYQTLAKPSFNPPDWVFAPVWTSLFVMMGIAAWRVWRRADAGPRRRALAMFAVQLVLNLGWSFLFFGLRRIELAAVEIIVLLATIVATMVVFHRVDRLAGALFVPYVLWVGYASVLTVALWQLNPG